MRFGVEDERAFQARADELVADYAGWLQRQSPVVADAGDARLALDWKWGYADGDVGAWTVADLDEFLLEWCPRKLSMAPRECGDFPVSIGVFCTFLAARGLLSARSDSAKVLHRHCERVGKKFVREMSNPANFGMAKGLLGQAGGLEGGLTEQDVQLVLDRLQQLPADDEDAEVLTVGPVRHPDPQQRAESAAAAPVLEQLRRLREYCAAPGRSMTQKGNLRLADARHLVDLLETGDSPDAGGRRALRSAEDLPELSWLVGIGLGGSVLRRHRGRIVAVARWAEIGPVDALDGLVDTAVELGLAGHNMWEIPGLSQVLDFVDDGVGRLLAELLEWRAAGEPTPVDELEELLCAASTSAFGGGHPLQETFVHSWVRRQVQRLEALGVLTVRDVTYDPESGDAEGGLAELTPAGVAVAVRLAEDLGITVLARPDPATATAADIVELVGRIPLEEWQADAAAWVQQRDEGDAAQQLVDALREPGLAASVVLSVLTELQELVGEHARPPVETMLDGPYDGFAVQWLVNTGARTPDEFGGERLLASGVDTLAVTLEVGGPDDLVAAFGDGDPAEPIALLEQLWRVDRPGTEPILEALGEHHPDRAVAKAARKCLLRYRSRAANNR